MKERPILFSGPMVRAILEGRKTQTRRVVKWPVRSEMANGVRRIWPPGHIEKLLSACWTLGPNRKDAHPHDRVVCPYGQAGDRLWVRETWKPIHHAQRASETYVRYSADDGMKPVQHAMKMDIPTRWRPSIHMPRWASRLTLEIVSVRVERLQDISEDDCDAEGYEFIPMGEQPEPDSPGWFRYLWQSINGKKSGARWSDNPWVWVIEFKVVAS